MEEVGVVENYLFNGFFFRKENVNDLMRVEGLDNDFLKRKLKFSKFF